MPHVIVAGGGLAGLSTSVWLSDRGYRVTLLEARARLGGRTFGIDVPQAGATVDNGQHAMLRCYTRLMEYLVRIGSQDQVTWTKAWVQREPGRGPVQLTPLHMLRSGAVPLREAPPIIRALCHLVYAIVRRPRSLDQLSVDVWLRRIGAPKSLRNLSFDPFVTALNDTPQRHSAYTMVETLRMIAQRSLKDPRNLGLGYATTDLNNLFVVPAELVLTQRGVDIRLSTKVASVNVNNERCAGVVLKGGEAFDADAVVLALPAWDAATVFEASDLGYRDFFDPISSIEAAPIVSTYVWLDRPLQMTQAFEGLLGTASEWVFDRTTLYGRRDGIGYGYSLVTGAAWRQQTMTNAQVVEEVLASLRTHFPEFADSTVVYTHVVRQPSATFSPRPGSQGARRPPRTPVPGLILAGDWTDLGMTSLMEGAVESGHRAVEEVERQLGIKSAVTAKQFRRFGVQPAADPNICR